MIVNEPVIFGLREAVAGKDHKNPGYICADGHMQKHKVLERMSTRSSRMNESIPLILARMMEEEKEVKDLSKFTCLRCGEPGHISRGS